MIWSPVGYLVQVCFTFLIRGLQRIYVRVGKAEERILVLGWKPSVHTQRGGVAAGHAAKRSPAGWQFTAFAPTETSSLNIHEKY